MKITVKLFGLHRVGRFTQEQRDYPAGTSPRQVFVDIGISAEQPGVVLVDGRPTCLDQPLVDGDSLSLLPLVSGG